MADAFDRLVSRVLDPVAVAQPRTARPLENPVDPRLADTRFETHLETEATGTDARRSTSLPIQPPPTTAPAASPRASETTDRRGAPLRDADAAHAAPALPQSLSDDPSTPLAPSDSAHVDAAVAPMATPAPLPHAGLRRASVPPSPAALRSDRDSGSDRSEPVVRITIGRLEVRADIASPIAPAARRRPERRVMPLEEYLERRAEGTRP